MHPLRAAAVLLLAALSPAASAAQPAPPEPPRLLIQTGHSERVNAVAYSPDGRLVASGGVDATVRLWDVERGLELRALRGHTSAVQALAFSPDGRALASAGTDAVVRLWDVASGRELRQFDGHGATLTSVAFSADGRLLATAGLDQAVRVWETATGRELRSMTTDTEATFKGFTLMALSPDGRQLVSGGEITKLWSTEGWLIRALTPHKPAGSQPDTALAMSPDGSTVVVAGRELALLDLATGRKRWEVPLTGIGVESLRFSPDGRTVIAGGIEIVFWDAATGRELRRIGELTDTARVAVSPDGRRLALAGGSTQDHAVRLLDAVTGRELRRFSGTTGPATALAFSPDGRALATGRRMNLARQDTVKIWDLASGQMSRTLTSGAVRDLAYSGDGRTLAGGAGLRIRLWDTATGQQLREINENPRSIDVLAYAADGTRLAYGERNGGVRILDAATGRTLHVLPGHPRATNALAFSPDGKRLASGGWDHLIRLWDVDSGRELRVLRGHSQTVYALAFSPDGKRLASSGLSQSVRLWNVQTGEQAGELATFPPPASYRIDSLAFDAQGQRLVAGVIGLLTDVGGALVWDVASGRRLHALAGPGATMSVAFSPDGTLVAGAADDAAIHLWDAASGAALAHLVAMDGMDWLVVTPDGLFDGSPAAWNQILWRFSPRLDDVSPVESFFNEFYRPGLLAELIRGERPKAAARIEQRDRRQPQVRLARAGTSAAGPVTARTLRLSVDVAAAPAGAKDLRLFRNGSLVKVWRGDVLAGKAGATLEADVPIVAGENRFAAYAFNRDDVKSADASLAIEGAASLARPATAWMLSVGINGYANPQFDLGFAVADAEDFAAEFARQQKGIGRFARIETVALNDARATKAAILQAIERIASQAQPEDAVIVYFAGHGTAAGQRFYLLPHDLGYAGNRDAIDERALASILEHGISDRDLERLFERTNASQLLLVIDACNSGQALEAEERRRGPMNSKGLAQLAYEKGMFVLTAAQSYQAAIEPADLKHGLLTYTLVEEGLKRSAADGAPKDGTILLREWLDYATDRVPQLQVQRMRAAGSRGRTLAYVPGEEALTDAERRNVQRPRSFYRRENEAQPFVVAAGASAK